MEPYGNQFRSPLSSRQDLVNVLVRPVPILRVGRPIRHDHDGIRERVIVARHDVVVEPLAENSEFLSVLLILRGSDVFANAPTNDDQLIP